MTNKVLVTGSSGFIGRWLVEQLKKDGYQVIGLDKVLPTPSLNLDEHIDCNILDKNRLLTEVKRVAPDALIHLAARTDLNEVRDVNGYADNIEGVQNVVEAVRQTSTIRRAIYTSSQLVCKVGYVPTSDVDYCPNTLYGESKVLTERIVREEDGGGVEWCLVRPTTVWGPYMSLHYQSMLRFIRNGIYFHAGSSKLYKSYSYAGNIAYQYARLLKAESNAIQRETLYLSDYEPMSLRDYADGLATEMDCSKIVTVPLPLAKLLALSGNILNKCGLKQFPYNTFRLNNILTEYVFDMAKTQAVCGPLPYSQSQGVQHTANWFLSLDQKTTKKD